MSELFSEADVQNSLELLIYRMIEARLPHKRFQHTLRVLETAQKLCLLYGGDRSKMRLAALLHDYAKPLGFDQMIDAITAAGLQVPPDAASYPEILHADASAALAITEFNINDPDIIKTIRSHTVGNDSLSIEDKVLYLADYVEDGRDFPGVGELRELTYKDMDAAMLLGCDMSILELVARRKLIHPMTINCRNSIILSRKV